MGLCGVVSGQWAVCLQMPLLRDDSWDPGGEPVNDSKLNVPFHVPTVNSSCLGINLGYTYHGTCRYIR